MLPHDSNSALKEHTCPNCGFKHTHKFAWDWGKFFQGKADNKLLAFIVTTVLVIVTLFINSVVTNIVNERVLLIIWGGSTAIYMLSGAIDIAISNMKISAELKAGASINKEVK